MYQVEGLDGGVKGRRYGLPLVPGGGGAGICRSGAPSAAGSPSGTLRYLSALSSAETNAIWRPSGEQSQSPLATREETAARASGRPAVPAAGIIAQSRGLSEAEALPCNSMRG